MKTYDGTVANVIAYANPFPAKPRIEVLVDWQDVSRWQNSERLSFKVYAVSQPTPPAISTRSQWNAIQIPLGNRFLSTDLWNTYHQQFVSVFDSISSSTALVEGLENFLSIGSPGKTHNFDLADGPHPFFDVIRPRSVNRNPGDLNAKYAVYAKRLLDWRRKLHEVSDKNPSSTEGTTDPHVSPENHLAAIRHACRDEVTFGHALNALHFFDLSEPTAIMTPFLKLPILWLIALPVDPHGNPLDPNEFVPVATRLVSDGRQLITYLEETASPTNIEYESAFRSYWAETVAVRQLISTEIPDPPSTSPTKALAIVERYSVAPSLTVTALRKAAKQLVQADGISGIELLQKSDEIVQAVRSSESVTVPYDKIGICWDRESVMPSTSPDYHVGYKGYRVDVFSEDGAKTESLCAADIRVTSTTNAQFAFRESALLGPTEGYVDITVQRDPTVPAPAPGSGFDGQKLALARDFCFYDGYSSVAQNPLDSLLKINSVGHSGPVVVTLVNLPVLSYKLRYGNKIGIQIRKLGMTGVGPKPGNVAKASNSNWLQFKRTVNVRSPEVRASVVGLTSPSAKETEKASTNQAFLRVTNKDHAKIFLQLRYPTVHWKVSWHARGEMGDMTDPEFQNTCEEFSRRGVREQLDEIKSGSADYLRAVDPHIKGVQVLTRIWYPFSDNKSGNRYVITGRRSFPINAVKMSVPQLIVKAEKRITEQTYDVQTDVSVSYPREFVYNPDQISDPVVLLGHRNQVECSGEWDEASSFQLEKDLLDGLNLSGKTADKRGLIESRRAGVSPYVWNLRVHPRTESEREKIGGTLGKPPKPIITTHYAGLKTRDLERWLPVPPTKGTSNNATGDSTSNPARGSTFQWRNFVFPSKNKPIASSLRQSYIDFVLGMLGPSEVIDGRQDDSEVLSVRILPSEKGKNFVASGFGFPSPVDITESGTGSIRYDTATLGRFSTGSATNPRSDRKLPFIEDDINWVVRLEWKFPIKSTHVQRPYDLAGVKEFRMYRTKHNDPLDSKPLLVGSISRPSETTLQTYNLDEVSWVFFDAIRDRQKHDFQYDIRAIPEDEEAYQTNDWASFHVNIPSSQFDNRPETVQILPMFPDESLRHIAIRVSASSKFRLAWRLSSIKQDPLLPTPPPIKVFQPNFRAAKQLEQNLNQRGSGGLVQPGLDELFPSSQPTAESVYGGSPNEPFMKDQEGWQFCTQSVVDSESTTVWIQKLSDMPLGNPFFKLQLTLYNPDQYPRLAHTAPSEIFQTEWVQSYPSDLDFYAPPIHESTKEIKIQNSWKYGQAPGDLLRYRYHFFAAEQPHPDNGNAAFHLATFYYSEPSLPIDITRPKLQAAMRRFVSDDLGELKSVNIFIVAEEGLVAPTYSVDENDGVHKSLERIFVALRSSKGAMTLPASLWTEMQ